MREGHRSIGERKYRRKDGSLADMEVSASTLSYGGREAMCIVAHDITERKLMEENLRQSLGVLLALREASQVLGSTLESEEIISRLLEIMRGVSNLTTVVISVQDEVAGAHIWRSAGLQNLWRRARFAPEVAAARRAALEDGGAPPLPVATPGTQARVVGGAVPAAQEQGPRPRRAGGVRARVAGGERHGGYTRQPG